MLTVHYARAPIANMPEAISAVGTLLVAGASTSTSSVRSAAKSLARFSWRWSWLFSADRFDVDAAWWLGEILAVTGALELRTVCTLVAAVLAHSGAFVVGAVYAVMYVRMATGHRSLKRKKIRRHLRAPAASRHAREHGLRRHSARLGSAHRERGCRVVPDATVSPSTRIATPTSPGGDGCLGGLRGLALLGYFGLGWRGARAGILFVSWIHLRRRNDQWRSDLADAAQVSGA